MRALLLRVSKSLSFGALVVFIAGWIAAVLIHPSPHWLFPGMFALAGVAMASILVYQVANQSFTDPIEDVQQETERPTTAALPADKAPWGHDGIPTVREAAKAHPIFAAFVGLFPLFTLGPVFQETRDNLWPYLFIPFMPAMWWLLIWLHVRGWITFDD